MVYKFGPGYGPERRGDRRFVPFECEPLVIKETKTLLRIFGFKNKRNVACGLVDLSATGARFLSRERLAIGTKVEMMINVKLFTDRIRTTGAVTWCAEGKKNKDRFSVGVSFQNLGPAQIRKIAAFRDYLDSPAFRQKERRRRNGLQHVDGGAFDSGS